MLVLYSAVKFMVILRRSELKQKLFDLFVDGMASEQFEVGGVINLFCEDFTKIMEGIESLLFQTFMDLFEDFSVIQVVGGCVEFKANEVFGLEALHALEDLSLVDLVAEDYL